MLGTLLSASGCMSEVSWGDVFFVTSSYMLLTNVVLMDSDNLWQDDFQRLFFPQRS